MDYSWQRMLKSLLRTRRGFIVGLSGVAVSGYLLLRKGENLSFPSMGWLPVVQASGKAREIKRFNPDSPTFMSQLASRERRFVQFSSVEFRGQLYMTPRDFLDSVTGGDPRPRFGRKVLGEDDLSVMLDLTPKLGEGSKNMFRDLNDKGLISYTEYLFFLSILTKPKSGFRIAFNMFDTDGNAKVSKDEFLVVMKLFSVNVRKTVRNYLTSDKSEALERIFSTAYRDRRGENVNSDSTLERRNKMNTTLLVHLFGQKGKTELTYDEFSKFMEDLQLEVLELEFYEFSRGMSVITEEGFAKILLRYTHLQPDEYDEFLDRLAKKERYDAGITFKDFKEFFQFLNSLDDFAIAMRMYTLADKSVSKSEFARAVKICTGASLAPHVVDAVFALFDVDGDGALSYKEFIAIMRDRLHRGVKSSIKAEGWEAFKHCLKQEMRSVV